MGSAGVTATARPRERRVPCSLCRPPVPGGWGPRRPSPHWPSPALLHPHDEGAVTFLRLRGWTWGQTQEKGSEDLVSRRGRQPGCPPASRPLREPSLSREEAVLPASRASEEQTKPFFLLPFMQRPV